MSQDAEHLLLQLLIPPVYLGLAGRELAQVALVRSRVVVPRGSHRKGAQPVIWLLLPLVPDVVVVLWGLNGGTCLNEPRMLV